MNGLFNDITCLEGERVTLKRLTASDADALRKLTIDADVYKYLPTFLYENKYEDKSYVIEHLYNECISESLILGVYSKDEFGGQVAVDRRRSPSAISFSKQLISG